MFLKLGLINIHDMNIKKMQFKKWGHRACLHVSGLLKWGIFTDCALKIRITSYRVKSWLPERHKVLS